MRISGVEMVMKLVIKKSNGYGPESASFLLLNSLLGASWTRLLYGVFGRFQ